MQVRLKQKLVSFAAIAFVVLIVGGFFLNAAGLFGGSGSAPISNVISSQPQSTNPTPYLFNPTEFTCFDGTPEAFNFTVKVDLSDGMSSTEASATAATLYAHELEQYNFQVKSVQNTAGGCWTVNLLWNPVTNGAPDANHYFNVHLNATDRTATYDRSY